MLAEPYQANPVTIFSRLYHRPYPFLLDSCGIGRYSFAGADPFILIKAENDKIEIIQEAGGKMEEARITTGNIFSILSSLLNDFKIKPKSQHFPFQGGAVGYLGYDLKNQLEKLPRKPMSPPTIPDCIIGLYDTIFVYDHKTNQGHVVSSGLPEENERRKKARAKERINQFLKNIEAGYTRNYELRITNYEYNVKYKGKGFTSNFTKEGYIQAIQRIQEYIAAGDIYQANLSQRLQIHFDKNPLLFYSLLRKINPVEFGTFFNFGDFQIISNSPERLLKVKDNIAETCPIKGTRPRGKNSKEDSALIKELKTNSKELAEHIMIVDMERNDLGKICEHDSIKVWPIKKIFTYPTLHHMVSTVKGKLRHGIGPVDCIKALFPGGSVTGAPKIRAMEVIDELEPVQRGIYTGAIGYIDFSGNMDLSMAIRTAVLKDNRLYLSVGGGIVADSDPEKEYEETMLKASAFLKGIGKK